MAMSPAAPVQIQSTPVRAVESRPNREEASSRADFGSELKRELSRDRSEESRVESSTTPATGETKEKAVAGEEPAQTTENNEIVQAATVDPWLAMLQGAAAGKVTTELPKDAAQTAVDLGETNQEAQKNGALVLEASVKPSNVFNLTLSQAKLAGDIQEQALTVPNSVSSAVLSLSDLNQIQTEAADAASVAVDAAKLAQMSVSAKSAEPVLAGELKAPIPLINEARPPSVSNAAQANPKLAEVPLHHIATPFGESRWGDAVAQRVGLMLGRQEQKIEMQLNPPNLGPMEVRLNLAQDQASVVFSSQNAAVREALVAAMPRLTTLLADQGFTLTNVEVASDSLQQHQQQQNQNQQAASGSGFNQQNTNRDLGGMYGAQVGIDGQKLQELGPMRLPLSKGGLSLFV